MGSELQPGELRGLVDGRIGNPPALSGPPQPEKLTDAVTQRGPAENTGRGTASREVRPLGRHTRVEEPGESRPDGVHVRVSHCSTRLVVHRVARQQNSRG